MIRLLLVEDNPSDAFILRNILETDYPGRYAIDQAVTMKEAKSLLAGKEFDAILLDLSLPDSQGLDTVHTLVSVAPQIPIIVLTGAAEESLVAQIVHTGAQDYLRKGAVDGSMIVRTIQYAMDRKKTEGQLLAQQRELEARNKELQETQRRLEAYRDRYIDLYDFAPLGYVTLDEDGYIQEINLAGAQLLNVDRDALTGYPFGEYVAKDDLPAFLNLLKTCAVQRREATAELRLALQDGRRVSVQLRSIPIQGSIGMKGFEEESVFCKTAITDITERKAMEEAIRQSHAFMQTVVDAIPDSVLVIDRDYHIVLANRAAREQSGESDMAANCLPCYQVSHHRNAPCDDDASHPCPLRESIQDKATVTVTHTHFDKQGREVFVEVMASPVFDESGEVSHIIEACRDVTNRKREEQSLVRDRNLLRTILDDLPDCVYVKDRYGRFLAANVATARVMGVATPNDLIGRTDADFYPAELAAQFRADEMELLRSGQPLVNKNEPRLDANGNVRKVLTTKVPLKDERDRIVGLVGVSRDISACGF